MLRLALHCQGHNCQVCTRARARGCRGSMPVLQLRNHDWLGYRRPEPNLQPFTEARKVFLASLNDWVCPRSEQTNPLRPRALHG
jgi:hypothetical protein